jgi:hypothetical protein
MALGEPQIHNLDANAALRKTSTKESAPWNLAQRKDAFRAWPDTGTGPATTKGRLRGSYDEAADNFAAKAKKLGLSLFERYIVRSVQGCTCESSV